MKQLSSITRLLAVFIIMAVFLTACQKENNQNKLTDAQEEQAAGYSSEADAEADVVFNDVFDNVVGVNDEVGMQGVGVFGRTTAGNNASAARGDSLNPSVCFTVSVKRLAAPAVFPVQITVDFGTGCTGRDGHIRSGKIITTYTNRILVPGAIATTTFDNFYFDSIHVEGTHTVTNTSIAASAGALVIPRFKITVENATLTKLNGNYTQWNSLRVITQVDGLATPLIPLDDAFSIEGSTNGKVKRGDILVAWNTEIKEPLIKRFACHWFVKGIVQAARLNISTNSPWVAKLNYGDGICDNKAVLTINGISKEITLP